MNLGNERWTLRILKRDFGAGCRIDGKDIGKGIVGMFVGGLGARCVGWWSRGVRIAVGMVMDLARCRGDGII